MLYHKTMKREGFIMNNVTTEQLIQGLEYSMSAADTINVVGAENCQKVVAIYNNIHILLNAIRSGQIKIVNATDIENDNSEE